MNPSRKKYGSRSAAGERPEPVAGLGVQAPRAEPADQPEGVSERPEEMPEPAAAGARRQDVEDRQPDRDDQRGPPAPGRPAARVDQLGRSGGRADQPGGDRRQPDPRRDPADPRRTPDADEAVAQPPAPRHPRRGFEQVAQAEELEHRQGRQRREAHQQRRQSEEPFGTRGNAPQEPKAERPDPRSGPTPRLDGERRELIHFPHVVQHGVVRHARCYPRRFAAVSFRKRRRPPMNRSSREGWKPLPGLARWVVREPRCSRRLAAMIHLRKGFSSPAHATKETGDRAAGDGGRAGGAGRLGLPTGRGSPVPGGAGRGPQGAGFGAAGDRAEAADPAGRRAAGRRRGGASSSGVARRRAGDSRPRWMPGAASRPTHPRGPGPLSNSGRLRFSSVGSPRPSACCGRSSAGPARVRRRPALASDLDGSAGPARRGAPPARVALGRSGAPAAGRPPARLAVLREHVGLDLEPFPLEFNLSQLGKTRRGRPGTRTASPWRWPGAIWRSARAISIGRRPRSAAGWSGGPMTRSSGRPRWTWRSPRAGSATALRRPAARPRAGSTPSGSSSSAPGSPGTGGTPRPNGSHGSRWSGATRGVPRHSPGWRSSSSRPATPRPLPS